MEVVVMVAVVALLLLPEILHLTPLCHYYALC